MLRKLTLALAIAATMMFSPVAFAGHGHGHGGRGHSHGYARYHHGHVHWNKRDWDRGRINWNATFRGRWWGGRWYGYGEGACWRWSRGGYVWICR
jgi:hypothetical protein